METEFKLVEIKEVSESLDCKLCSRPVQDPDLPENIDLGPLYEYGVCRAHHFCLMFSSGLEQKGEEDQGIMGFQPDDIIKEWKRGSFLKCFYCKKKYSTVGCIATGCRKCYHLPCGLENGSLQQFFGNFGSYCFEHRPLQEPKHKPGSKKSRECGICLDNLNPKSYQNLYSPCCGGYFHRNCMRRMAYTAGAHFFKCPLCNNRDEFTEEMLQFGIYIPEQDAKWETDDGGFEDLLVRPDSCDAEVCLCPEGRKIDREDTVWETIICVVCGSKGIHIECGGLNFDRPRWKCDICRDLLKNVPSRPVSVFSRVKLDSSSNDKQQILARVTERTKFKLKSRGKGKKKWDNLEVTVGNVRLSFDPAPAVLVPMPVKLFSVDKRNESKPKPTVVETKNTEIKELMDVDAVSEEENNESGNNDKENITENLKESSDSPCKSSTKIGKGQSTISQFFFPRQNQQEQAQSSKRKRDSEVNSPAKQTDCFTSPRKKTKLDVTISSSSPPSIMDKECLSPEETPASATVSQDDELPSPTNARKITSPEEPRWSGGKPSGGVGGGFVCQYCKISFSSLVTWKQHEASHKTGAWCVFCDIKFDSEKLLKKHNKEKHTENPEESEETEIECLICGYMAKTKRGLKIHNVRAHEGREKPKEDNKRKSTSDDSNQEEKAKPSDSFEVYKCDFCTAIFVGKQAVLQHMKVQHEDVESTPSENPEESDIEKEEELKGFDDDDVSLSEPIKDKLAKILDDWNDDSNTN